MDGGFVGPFWSPIHHLVRVLPEVPTARSINNGSAVEPRSTCLRVARVPTVFWEPADEPPFAIELARLLSPIPESGWSRMACDSMFRQSKHAAEHSSQAGLEDAERAVRSKRSLPILQVLQRCRWKT
jgi:hypothetical protein